MSRYFQYGYQPRYAFNWHAGQGGVMPQTGAPASSLGNADLVESGYTDPIYEPYPALAKIPRCIKPQPCGLRATAAAQLAGLGDWPLLRPAGPEPEAMHGDILGVDTKTIALVGAGVLAYLLLFKGKRRNPWTVTSRSRGVTGTLVFSNEKNARDYAAYLRKARKKARVRFRK